MLKTWVFYVLVCLLLQKHTKCVVESHIFMMDSFRQTYPDQINDKDETSVERYIKILEAGLSANEEPNASEFDFFMLRVLARKMDEFNTKSQLQSPEFWHLRQGRK